MLYGLDGLMAPLESIIIHFNLHDIFQVISCWNHLVLDSKHEPLCFGKDFSTVEPALVASQSTCDRLSSWANRPYKSLAAYLVHFIFNVGGIGYLRLSTVEMEKIKRRVSVVCTPKQVGVRKITAGRRFVFL